MEQIIQLAPDDDITAIKTHLEWADARRVLLVVPRQNKVLRNLVYLKLLARTANTLNIELALITADFRIQALARQAGIKFFAFTWIARRTGFISDPAPKIIPPQIKLAETPSPPRMRWQNKKLVVVVGSNRVGWLQQLIALILTAILGLGVVVLALSLAPAATITLVPQVDMINTQISLTADPNPEITAIDPETGVIPARAVQADITLFTEVPTIDRENAPADKAVGRVVLVNRTQDAQTVPLSTTVRTSSGVPIEFITVQEVTVPAGTGATVEVPVIAVEPGTHGNVSAGQINRFNDPTLGLLLRVINESSTGGGTVREAGIVTDGDKDRVRAKLRQLIQQAGYDKMVAELEAQEFIPPESLQVIELNLTYDKFSGDVSETLGAEMQAVVRGTAIADYNANQLAYFSLLNRVPFNKALLPKGLRFSAGGITAVDDRVVTFPVMAKGIVVSDIDQEAIKNAITFMPIGEAQAWISRNVPIVSVPGIEVSPNWLGRLPIFPFRITVIITDVTPLIFKEVE